jgi:hypothetical protein
VQRGRIVVRVQRRREGVGELPRCSIVLVESNDDMNNLAPQPGAPTDPGPVANGTGVF